MPKPFAELTSRTQALRLRVLARHALTDWELRDAELRLVHHGYNTTFRVTAGGVRFALRVNVQPHKELSHLRAELAWLDALTRQTDLVVPVPQPTASGELFSLVHSEEYGRELPIVLFSWLPGRLVGRQPSKAQLRALGRAMARLHEHAERWQLPADADLPRIDNVLMNVPDRLDLDHPLLDADRHAILRAAMDQVAVHHHALFASATPHALHADLHGGNLMWSGGNLSVFDFDDAGIGVAVQDLAIATYYLRDHPDRERWLREGYEQVRPLPRFTPDQFEALVAGRNLVLVNDILVATNAEFRDLADRYVPNTVVKLHHYLETGRYRHDVEGVVPLG